MKSRWAPGLPWWPQEWASRCSASFPSPHSAWLLLNKLIHLFPPPSLCCLTSALTSASHQKILTEPPVNTRHPLLLTWSPGPTSPLSALCAWASRPQEVVSICVYPSERRYFVGWFPPSTTGSRWRVRPQRAHQLPPWMYVQKGESLSSVEGAWGCQVTGALEKPSVSLSASPPFPYTAIL